MALGTFEKLNAKLLQHEGGYVDHPRDPGGATNYGITQATLSAWRGKRVSKSDVRNLTVAEALRIYRARYWDTVQGDLLPAGVDYAVFDFAVNSGPARAAKYLQRIVGASPDGIIGPMTHRAIKNSGLIARQIAEKLCDARLAFMKRLRTWGTFGKGWGRRVSEVRRVSASLAVNPIEAMETDFESVYVDADEPTRTAKARVEDTAAWKTPEGLATATTVVSGLGGTISQSSVILQGAFALVFVLAAAAVGYYLLKKVREQ